MASTNFHSTVAELFQFGPKCWTDRPTLPSLEPFHKLTNKLCDTLIHSENDSGHNLTFSIKLLTLVPQFRQQQ